VTAALKEVGLKEHCNGIVGVTDNSFDTETFSKNWETLESNIDREMKALLGDKYREFRECVREF